MQGNQRTQYEAQYTSLLGNVQSFIEDANYNGKSLIGNITGSSGTFGARGRGAQRERRDLRHCHVRRLRVVRLDRLHHHADERCLHRCGVDQRYRHLHQPDERGRYCVERDRLPRPTT